MATLIFEHDLPATQPVAGWSARATLLASDGERILREYTLSTDPELLGIAQDGPIPQDQDAAEAMVRAGYVQVYDNADGIANVPSLDEAVARIWRWAVEDVQDYDTPEEDDAVTDEPTVDVTDRESLIRWLVWNDPNGCYTDEDRDRESTTPAPLDELLSHYRQQNWPQQIEAPRPLGFAILGAAHRRDIDTSHVEHPDDPAVLRITLETGPAEAHLVLTEAERIVAEG